MGWSFAILIAASAAAGLALGRVISRSTRRFLLIGGIEAGLLGLGLLWVGTGESGMPLDSVTAQLLALGCLAVAAVLLPFGLGAAWSGP